MNLGRIFSDAKETLAFQFRARPMGIDVETYTMPYQTPGDPSVLKLKGALLCSDAADPELIPRLLRATHNGKPLEIAWKSDQSGLKHEFEVLGIARGAKRGQLRLAWDGAPLSAKTKGQTDWPVPAVDEFIVLRAWPMQSERRCIAVALSDPLSSDQSADGLIRLPGSSGRLSVYPLGSNLLIYPNTQDYGYGEDENEDLILEIDPGLRNSRGMRMTEASSWPVSFSALKPGVRLVGQGAILPRSPDNGKALFPFEAVGLDAVDLEVFKIYNNNILQFLQANDLEGESDLERVGRIVLQKKISLSELNPRSNRSSCSATPST